MSLQNIDMDSALMYGKA